MTYAHIKANGLSFPIRLSRWKEVNTAGAQIIAREHNEMGSDQGWTGGRARGILRPDLISVSLVSNCS